MLRYILYSTIIILNLQLISFAQSEYSSEILCTIPWGNETGMISDDFKTIGCVGHNEIFEPGPWAISNSGYLAIIEETQYGRFVMKFDPNGNFIVRNNLLSLTGTPWRIAVLDSGEVAISVSSVPQAIVILDSNLNVIEEIFLAYSDYGYYDLTPSNQNSFWLAFWIRIKIEDVIYKQHFKTEIFLDGTYSTPEITWDDISNTGFPARYISPTGEPYLCNADKYGYLYSGIYAVSEERTLIKSKLNQQGTEYDIVYTHTSVSDPGWELFETLQNTGPRHFTTWDGDFYTIHATDAGMVLTKYTLQLE